MIQNQNAQKRDQNAQKRVVFQLEHCMTAIEMQELYDHLNLKLRLGAVELSDKVLAAMLKKQDINQELIDVYNPPTVNIRTLIAENADLQDFFRLEPKELQIATMMAQGKSNQEIATELSLVYKTIKNYCAIIWCKLGVFDAGQARKLRTQARAKDLA